MTQIAKGDANIRTAGIQVLNKKLGHTGAMKFITLVQREPTDYVQVSRKLYKGQTVDTIYARAKKRWNKAS
jgi:hypothetical protein